MSDYTMSMPTHHWLIRSPYQHKTWDDVLMRNLFRLQGIRNPEASKNIGKMRVGDQALFYNNIHEKAIYGILEVIKVPYSDPTTNEARWMAVDLVPGRTFETPIVWETLKEVKCIAASPLITRPRLSVAPLGDDVVSAVISLL